MALSGGLGGLRGRVGLRAAVTLAFALGALVLSVVLSLTTFAVVRHYLLAERETSALAQAYEHARVVKEDLAGGSSGNVEAVLTSLRPAAGTAALIYRSGRWFSASVTFGPHDLPKTFTSVVLAGSPARERIVASGTLVLAMGIPIPSLHVAYFEVRPLGELQRTLAVLTSVLVVSAMATTLGGALLGQWASTKLLKPLREVVEVAALIGEGDLDKRLPETLDGDLRPLVGSFNTMVDVLEQRLQRDARFASDVSHELRSPLTTLGTSIELLAHFRSSLPPEGGQALDLLSAEVRRLSTMVQDLLEMARVDAGAEALNLAPVDLGELVTEAVRAHIGGAVVVDVDRSGPSLEVLADKRRMQRVVANLLDNAAIHGEGVRAVSVSAQPSEVSVSVDDAGPGVAEEERGLIFGRFYRGAAAGRRGEVPGTGLGLALVAEHVRGHRGHVRVTSSPAGGARFTVSLPALVPGWTGSTSETGAEGPPGGALRLGRAGGRPKFEAPRRGGGL